MLETRQISNFLATNLSIRTVFFVAHWSGDQVINPEQENKFSILIKKGKDVLPWKDFNKNMAVSVEYNLEY